MLSHLSFSLILRLSGTDYAVYVLHFLCQAQPLSPLDHY